MMTSTSNKDYSYGDDAIARLTGLTLNPETAPSQPTYNAYVGPKDVTAATSEKGEEKANSTNTPFMLTLRSLVTTKEAGVVIGKAGKNVADVREETGVKAGVSKVVPGVYERVLSITGALESVSKAYAIVAKHLLDNPLSTHNSHFHNPSNMSDHTTLRLLVPHQLMGSIIGKAGTKIREIQEQSGCKIIISKEMLPQSTERIIEIFGLVDSIQSAVQYIGECVLNDMDRASGSIPYNPQAPINPQPYPQKTYIATPPLDDNSETRNVPIPAAMVGCIIGRAGVFINEIRKMSGCRISISKLTDPETNQRTFSVTGSQGAIEKALNMLYNQLDKEKERRMAAGEEQ
jgi:heterogeneous nuclear rnp K-like protein 2